ncbi:PucR family transcriptional regulator [Saccharopolyspora phatthalungensis]|uniref:Sugar diacid utilization regulator n=1 Tax=Saccharopolyspora phatthalungensis TaxID=664693 RepID=A0A840QF00_9PSEU|nr:helix-turn-helix domain-containing protein [Saccharopolyspora phatthalungensis]MBB5158611.1 sugar diacid utilization regulator [Saccharopolyspora phatthalungensis]
MDDPNTLAIPRNTDAWAAAPGSDLHRLFQLSMTMFERRDQENILRLAMSSVPALGPCQARSGYLLRDRELIEFLPDDHAPAAELADRLRALQGEDGLIAIPGAAWARAFGLRRPGGLSGYLVVTGEAEPSPHELFLLNVLAQQTAAAVANASLHQVEREHALQLSRLSDELAIMNQRLKDTVEDLQRRQLIHDAFTRIVASDGHENEIAATLHALTDRAVAVEDRFGNLLSWAGPGRPDPYPEPNLRREETLQQAANCNGLTRDRDRLVMVAQPRQEILGVIVLFDPGPTLQPQVIYALEHAAMALELRLSHARNLAEVELRLRRDLVEDLLAGTSDHSVFARSEAVGHNLHGPHYAVALQWLGAGTEDALAIAAWKAAKKVGMSILLARRSGMVVLFSSGRPDGAAFYRAVADEMGNGGGAIGVGGRCDSPADFARSFQEALRSLRIRQQSRLRNGITFFDELGIYRILGQGEGGADIETFVQEWLGSLQDYDRRHHSNLVPTLSQYLECGGNYSATASALVIHRSTLRYRLRRIREISHLDINDVDSRLNLHVATRAWRVLGG